MNVSLSVSFLDSEIILTTFVAFCITLFGLSTGFILLKIQSNLVVFKLLKKLFARLFRWNKKEEDSEQNKLPQPDKENQTPNRESSSHNEDDRGESTEDSSSTSNSEEEKEGSTSENTDNTDIEI